VSFDFASVCPRDWHAGLAWLGRFDWLELIVLPERHSGSRVRWEVFRGKPGWDQNPMLERVLTIAERNGVLPLVWLDALAAALAGGPKLFRPTEEQFEVMEQVELRLPFDAYRQPFPAVTVQVPPGARARIERLTGKPAGWAPAWVLVRHRPRVGESPAALFTGARMDGMDQTDFFHERHEFPFIEGGIRARYLRPGDEEAPFVAMEAVTRASLNLMLMLAHWGHKGGGPLDPEAYAKHRRKPQLERLRHGDFLTVNMVQDVLLRAAPAAAEVGEPGEPTGRELRPHWRRGHWRHQRFGPGGAAVRLQFIEPVLIRADRAVGELAASSYAIRAGGPG
jgi:hypothetical protein